MDEIERKRAEELGFEFEEGKEPGEPFWPDHVLTQVISVFIALAILLGLAILFPWGLHEKADPISTPHGIKPEWYFLSSYQLLKYMPKWLGMLISSAGFGLLVLWPFLDRRPVKSGRKRPISMLIAAGGVTMVLTLTILGHLSENTYILFGKLVFFDAKSLTHTLEKGPDGKYGYYATEIDPEGNEKTTWRTPHIDEEVIQKYEADAGRTEQHSQNATADRETGHET